MFSGRILFDLVLLSLAATGAFQASRMSGFGQIGPGGFPMAIMGLGVLVMLVILAQDLRRAARPQSAPDEDQPAGVSLKQAGGMAGVALLLALYIAALEPLGFIAATLGFLFIVTLLSTWLLDPPARPGGWGRVALGAAIFAVLATLLSFYAFTKGFGLVFP